MSASGEAPQVELLMEVIRHEGLWGKELQPSDVAKLGTILFTGLCLPIKTVIPVRQTCMGLVGCRLDENTARDICYKVTYGKERLRALQPLGALHLRNERAEFVCDDVSMSARPAMALHIQSGALANEHRVHLCSPQFIQWFGTRLGLKGRRWRSYHPREFVGMRFAARIGWRGQGIRISEFRVSKAQKAKNTQLRRSRQRERSECGPCYRCPATPEDCTLATHQSRWSSRKCNEGHDAVFSENEGCLLCADRAYMAESGVDSFEEAN